ncbi:MAG: alpha/beta hydrolase [Microthrixaceae bacterium]
MDPHHPERDAHDVAAARRGRRTWALVLLGLTAMVAACVPPPPEPATGPDPDEAPRAGEAAYAEHGPFEVGVTTIDLSDRRMEVWYPVDPEDIGTAPRDEYFIRDYVSTAFDQLLPPEINPPFVTDATRGVPASAGGPFPLVLFSHGFASYRTQSTALTTHLASWGFVVISPDYLERGLRSVLGEPPARRRDDVDVADEAIESIRAATADPANPLGGVVDASSVYPVGHSAGGGTTLRLLERADVPSGIPLAAGYSLAALLNQTLTLPDDKPIAWIAAPHDGIASIADVRRGFEYTPGQRKLVEIARSGHNNAFTDICEIGDGGVAALARSTGLPIPEALLALGDDGCSVPRFKDSPEVWPEVRHFVTAELRHRSGLDAEPVGLGSQVVAAFDDIARYRHNP